MYNLCGWFPTVYIQREWPTLTDPGCHCQSRTQCDIHYDPLCCFVQKIKYDDLLGAEAGPLDP